MLSAVSEIILKLFRKFLTRKRPLITMMDGRSFTRKLPAIISDRPEGSTNFLKAEVYYEDNTSVPDAAQHSDAEWLHQDKPETGA